MVTVEGKGGIKATIVADSISEGGVRITTFELEYHRYIHSEFMTHRQFSRNAASSRAIPIDKVIEQVLKSTAYPIHWGKNQSGMQAKDECYNEVYSWKDDVAKSAPDAWFDSAQFSALQASRFHKAGYHKQIVNRILEPYQMIKVVCTATEYDNFFYLRDHPDAQPEIAELAHCMKEARDMSEPQLLSVGEWHLPYIDKIWRIEETVTLENAIKISASLCAQVSYRKADESIEKALKIYDMLVNMKPVHASPFEHQATPMLSSLSDVFGMFPGYEEGYTHTDRKGNRWSGNFRGWIQHRQLIPGHVYTGE